MPLSRAQLWTVFTAAWSTTTIAAGFAFLGPFLSLLLERQTGSGSFIGAFATVGALTTVALTPFGPWLMRRVPAPRLVAIGLVGSCLCFPLYPLADDPIWWFPIRFVQGLFLTSVFFTGETWINTVIPDAVRARVLSIYAIFLAGGLGAGAAAAGLLIDGIGVQGALPFYIGAGVVATGLLPLLARAHLPMTPPSDAHSGLGSLLRIFRQSPGLLASVFVFGAIEFTLFHMVPVYGVRMGFAESRAALLLLAMPAGSLLLTYPIGIVADRASRHRVLAALFATCIATGLLIGLLSGFWTLLITLAVFVGAAGGLYTVGLALLSERNTGPAIAAANSAFIFTYGLGSLASPLAVGAGMDAFGPRALPLILAALGTAGLAVFALAEARRATLDTAPPPTM